MFVSNMKTVNKFLTFLFLLVFLVSNTGLPLSLHLCRMMNSVSTEACDMCSNINDKNDCCSNDQGEITISGYFNCCQTKMAAEPIKEKFISAKDDLQNNIPLLGEIDSIVKTAALTESYIFCEIKGSPPQLKDLPVFLLNSSFLI